MKHLSLPDPSQLALPPDHSAPHPHLAVHTGGACRHCESRSTSLELVRRHLSKTHRCKSNRKHWLLDDLNTGLQLQTWTSNGEQGYWIVQGMESSANATADLDSSPCRRQQVAALHEEERQRLHERLHTQSTTDTGIDDLALQATGCVVPCGRTLSQAWIVACCNPLAKAPLGMANASSSVIMERTFSTAPRTTNVGYLGLAGLSTISSTGARTQRGIPTNP